MNIQTLLGHWQASYHGKRTSRSFPIELPIDEAAKILALAEMYPDQNQAQIITDLLRAALNELEEYFPYQAGNRQVTTDENGDPIYEDVGLTPKFLRLSNKYRKLLEDEIKEST